MAKKFDVVIGNPPYQKEAVGENNRKSPIYHLFMDAAYEVAHRAVLITPSRFLFNGGQTPKKWNKKMLSDPCLFVAHYFADGAAIFPGADLKGGVAVTVRDSKRSGPPIGEFVPEPMSSILAKTSKEPSLARFVSSTSAYRYTPKMHEDYPQASEQLSSSSQFKVNTNAFERLDFIFHTEKPAQEDESYVEILGLQDNKRTRRWIRAEYISGPASMDKFKVAVAKSNGGGQFGEALAGMEVLEPNTGTTQTFVTIGHLDSLDEAEACRKYISSKFARAHLSVLKITQDNPPRVWEHVPLQDFTNKSDIDWSKSIPEIDQQLYAKYDLNADEIEFIENNVKPMS